MLDKCQDYEQRLRELYKEMVLDTIIPEASAFKVALACRKPVEFYSAKTPAATATRELAEEIVSRIAGRVKKQKVG